MSVCSSIFVLFHLLALNYEHSRLSAISGTPDRLLERWSVGVLECWSVGVLECWSVGVLECWSVGVLELSLGF
jgi:hypothetical protein